MANKKPWKEVMNFQRRPFFFRKVIENVIGMAFG